MRARLGGLLLLLSFAASAHEVPHPRRLLLKAEPGRLEAVFTLELRPKDAARTRRLFDRDRDGELAPSEAASLADYLERRAVGEFELMRGGVRLEPEQAGREVVGAESGAKVLAIRVVRRWPLQKSERSLEVRDGGDSEGHIPVRLEAKGVVVRFGAAKVAGGWNLPARERVSLRILPSD